MFWSRGKFKPFKIIVDWSNYFPTKHCPDFSCAPNKPHFRSEPLRAFDLGQPVADVEWAPYTSTVFAAVTSDGRVHIFDLNLSRFHAIHKQHVVSSQQNNEPTRLSFNRVEPVLTVGDKRGRITSIKLSPNLRTPAKASKKDVVDQWELEVRKLEKIVSYMKPKVLEPPPDVPSIPE